MRYYQRGFQILLDKRHREQLWHQSKFAIVTKKEKKRRDKQGIDSCSERSYSDFDGSKADRSVDDMFTLKAEIGDSNVQDVSVV